MFFFIFFKRRAVTSNNSIKARCCTSKRFLSALPFGHSFDSPKGRFHFREFNYADLISVCATNYYREGCDLIVTKNELKIASFPKFKVHMGRFSIVHNALFASIFIIENRECLKKDSYIYLLFS